MSDGLEWSARSAPCVPGSTGGRTGRSFCFLWSPWRCFSGRFSCDVAIAVVLSHSGLVPQLAGSGNAPRSHGRGAAADLARPTGRCVAVADPDQDDRPVVTTAARWIALGASAWPWSRWCFPSCSNPDGLGFADWDFVLDKFEALRRTILVWGQFPWWNPWCRGGFPLAAEPQIGAVSIATPLVLLLGTTIGLRIAAVLCVLIAVEGAYRLAWLWFREPWSATAAALIYGLNGAVIDQRGAGVHPGHELLQRSLAGLSRLPNRPAISPTGSGWVSGWPSWCMNGIQYLSLYGAVLAALVWIRALRVQRPEERSRLLVHTLAALGVFLRALRLAPGHGLAGDERRLRERITYWDESPSAIFHYLLERPTTEWATRACPVRFTPFTST